MYSLRYSVVAKNSVECNFYHWVADKQYKELGLVIETKSNLDLFLSGLV